MSYFVDKLHVFTLAYNSRPPCIGKMRCNIIESKQETFIIDTSLPDDIESKNEEYKFEMFRNQASLNHTHLYL